MRREKQWKIRRYELTRAQYGWICDVHFGIKTPKHVLIAWEERRTRARGRWWWSAMWKARKVMIQMAESAAAYNATPGRTESVPRDTLAEQLELLVTRKDREIERLKKRLADAHAEMKRTVDKLPKTKDGVPVTPGMEVWEPDGTGGYQPFVASSVNMLPSSPGHNVYGDCYSTREAVNAAGR